jgi:hypothetical protein
LKLCLNQLRWRKSTLPFHNCTAYETEYNLCFDHGLPVEKIYCKVGSKLWLLPASVWLFAWLILSPRRRMRHIPPKHHLTFNGPHGITSQKIETFHHHRLITSCPARFNMYTESYFKKCDTISVQFIYNVGFLYTTLTRRRLRHYDISRKVAGRNPRKVAGRNPDYFFFKFNKSFQPHYDPRTDSVCNRNQNQEYSCG